MQVPSSPLPLNGPVAQRLSITGSIGGEDGLLSTVLPQDLLVDVLADRLMVGPVSLQLNGKRTVSVAAPSIWHELPTTLQLCESLASFRKNINKVFGKSDIGSKIYIDVSVSQLEVLISSREGSFPLRELTKTSI